MTLKPTTTLFQHSEAVCTQHGSHTKLVVALYDTRLDENKLLRIFSFLQIIEQQRGFAKPTSLIFSKMCVIDKYQKSKKQQKVTAWWNPPPSPPMLIGLNSFIKSLLKKRLYKIKATKKKNSFVINIFKRKLGKKASCSQPTP